MKRSFFTMNKNRIINLVTIGSLFLFVFGGALLGIYYGVFCFPETRLSSQQEVRQTFESMIFTEPTSFDFEQDGLAYHVSYENGELSIVSESQSEFVYLCGFFFALVGFSIWFFVTFYLCRKICGR